MKLLANFLPTAWKADCIEWPEQIPPATPSAVVNSAEGKTWSSMLKSWTLAERRRLRGGGRLEAGELLEDKGSKTVTSHNAWPGGGTGFVTLAAKDRAWHTTL